MNLRDNIAKLRTAGALNEIERMVDWKYEIGMICRKDYATPHLFSNIKDYQGYSLFTGNFTSVKSISIVLGMENKRSIKEISSSLSERLQKEIKPSVIGKTYSQGGFTKFTPVNLLRLPVPWWDIRDAGRYIGTWHANITKDVQSKIRNVGIYRMMVVDENHTTISISKKSHLAEQFLKAEKKGMDLEMVTAIGTQEEIVLAASAAVPCGIDELDIAGSVSCQPVILGRCETIALEYPVESEIILEGKVKAGIRIKDGPFADYTGVTSSNKNALLYEVTAMYCKDRCIFRGMAVGRPGAEDHKLLSILASMGMMNFHGSKVKNQLQSMLIKYQLYRLFQLAGRTWKLK